MCRMPFKDHCINFWPLNGSFDSAVKKDGSEMIFHNASSREFNLKDKCLNIQNKNSYIRIHGERLKEPLTLIFQAKDLNIIDETKLIDKRFINSDNSDVDVYSFDFWTNISLLKQNDWVTHVVVYEKNRTRYYMNGILVSIREEGMRHEDIVFNDERNPKRIVCTGKIRNIGLYDIPFTDSMIRGINYFDFYRRSIINTFVNHMFRKKGVETA